MTMSSFSNGRVGLYDLTQPDGSESMGVYTGNYQNAVNIIQPGSHPVIVVAYLYGRIILLGLDFSEKLRTETNGYKMKNFLFIEGTYIVLAIDDSRTSILMIDFKNQFFRFQVESWTGEKNWSENRLMLAKGIALMPTLTKPIIEVEDLSSQLKFHKCQEFTAGMDCQKCNDGFELQSDGSCTCGDGCYIKDYDVAGVCHSSCQRCSGPEESDCTK